MKTSKHYFNSKGHLSDEGVAQWVDKLAGKHPDKIPEAVASHVEECLECKEAIIDLRSTIRDLALPGDYAFENLPSPRELLIERILKSKTFRIAAAIVLLVSIGTSIGLFVLNRGSDADKLFVQNFTPYADLLTTKAPSPSNDTIPQLQNLAFAYYNEGNYDSAAVVFRYLMSRNFTNDTVAFFLANSILASNQSPVKAIEILKGLSGKNGTFQEQARWYLALAFLKKHNIEIARKELLLLISTSTTYQERARKLLEDIN